MTERFVDVQFPTALIANSSRKRSIVASSIACRERIVLSMGGKKTIRFTNHRKERPWEGVLVGC